MEIDKKALGRRIKNIRVNEGDTLEKFSNKINEQSGDIIKSGKSNVSRWEKGENIPNDITLKAIAELGEISVDELLYGNIADEVTELEAFIDYLKSIDLPVRIEEEGERSHQEIETNDTNDRGQEIEIINVPHKASFVIIDEANGISVHYTEEEFKALQQTMKETVEYQLWKKQNN